MQFPSIFPTNIIFYIKSTHLNKKLNSQKNTKIDKTITLTVAFYIYITY